VKSKNSPKILPEKDGYKMDLLADKVVVVTGAARGIGLAIDKHFGRAGAGGRKGFSVCY
jgi:hypothetical protein